MKSKLTQKEVLVSLISVILITIIFETLQQNFYIEVFDLKKDSDFFVLMYKQAMSWLIWLVSLVILVKFIRNNSLTFSFNGRQILKYVFVILNLIILNILIISYIRLVIINKLPFSFDVYFSQYVKFFAFQKTPLYTLSYIAVSVIFNLYYKNEALYVKVLKLSELKDKNEQLYNELKTKHTAKEASFLNIKVGNKRKIISIDDIEWIEADDYCVIVHSAKESSYTMRSTLKSLENKLGDNFIRVHRSALVNTKMVKELILDTNPKIILNNNSEISISKRNLKTIKNLFQ